MRTERYQIVVSRSAYAVNHNGATSGSYATREGAFEAAVGAASNAIRAGYEVTINVPAATERRG